MKIVYVGLVVKFVFGWFRIGEKTLFSILLMSWKRM